MPERVVARRGYAVTDARHAGATQQRKQVAHLDLTPLCDGRKLVHARICPVAVSRTEQEVEHDATGSVWPR
jgi:hypothetical protein